MRRWAIRVGLLALVVAAAWGLRYWVLRPDPVEVDTTEVERGRVEATITNTRAGTVKAHRRARLSPETGGTAIAIPFEKGDHVEQGEVLLRLDDSLQRAQLALAEKELGAAEARRHQACVMAERNARELERIRRLAEQEIVSTDILDETESAAETSRAACEAATSEVARARSAVDLARVEVRKMTLRAPFDGVIADISIEVGEWTSPSPPALPIPPVIDIIDTGSIYISAPMDEVDADRLRVGLPARVTVDSHRGREFRGRIVRVAPYVLDLEAQNRTVEIDVELEDSEFAATLKPGTSADVEVILEVHPDALRIPTTALFEGNRVLVVEEGRLAERSVEVGLKNWDYTEVLAGLDEGETIVTTLDRPEIRPGALVASEASSGEGPRPAS